MKLYQWAGIMWILCMICYYVSDKHIGPLVTAVLFIILAFASLIYYIGNSD